MLAARSLRRAECPGRTPGLFFRVLGNPVRVLLVWLLSEQSRTLDEITLLMGGSPTAALRHLRILKYSGLVEEHTDNGCTYYQTSDDQELMHCLIFRNKPKELLQHFGTN